jgi:hypothetical protein
VNYTELYDAVVEETENDDETFVANIPIFVKNAEKRIYQAVKIPELRKNQTGNLQLNVPYLTLPTDYLSFWELATIDSNGLYAHMLPKDVSFMREAYPSPTYTGLPKYFAQFDANTFIVAPTPNDNYDVELHYFYYPESIVTASTTWLGNNFDNTLLYGTLVEAAVFMKSEEDIMKAYSEQYTVNLKLLQVYSDGQLRSGYFRK